MRSHVFNNIKYAKLLNRLIIKASDPAIRRSIDLTFRQTLTSVQIDLNLDLIIDLHMTSRRITKLTLTLNLALPGLSRVPVQLRKVSAQRREVVTRVGWGGSSFEFKDQFKLSQSTSLVTVISIHICCECITINIDSPAWRNTPGWCKEGRGAGGGAPRAQPPPRPHPGISEQSTLAELRSVSARKSMTCSHLSCSGSSSRSPTATVAKLCASRGFVSHSCSVIS